jgi:hypothetical protein
MNKGERIRIENNRPRKVNDGDHRKRIQIGRGAMEKRRPVGRWKSVSIVMLGFSTIRKIILFKGRLEKYRHNYPTHIPLLRDSITNYHVV